VQETASTPSTLLPPSSAANSDAAPDGKKQRTGSKASKAAERRLQPAVSSGVEQGEGGEEQQLAGAAEGDVRTAALAEQGP
jgi:hypothetical protein